MSCRPPSPAPRAEFCRLSPAQQAGWVARAVQARITLPKASEPTPADSFYLASFKRKSMDGCATFWGPNKCGYSTDLEYAGIYTKAECDSICTQGTEVYTVPVPVEFIKGLRIRRTIDPGDSLNEAFWTADTLRTALRAKEGRTL